GMARALELAVNGLGEECARLAALRDRLEVRLTATLDDVGVNGPRARRLPGTTNLSFAGVEANALVMSLPDLAFSTGSACTSTHSEPSPVLRAMGVDTGLAAGSIRLGVGRFTGEAEVDRAADRIIEEVRRLRHGNR
ncbi:MAG: IscS subfamily cysteine desulfurase, partial [Acidobacteriota bacterium]